jgi:hypothetical protein
MSRPLHAASGMPGSTLTDSTHSGEHDGADITAVRDDGPEAAEIRAQEIRAQGGETGEGQGRGESRVQEALETTAAVAEEGHMVGSRLLFIGSIMRGY